MKKISILYASFSPGKLQTEVQGKCGAARATTILKLVKYI